MTRCSYCKCEYRNSSIKLHERSCGALYRMSEILIGQFNLWVEGLQRIARRNRVSSAFLVDWYLKNGIPQSEIDRRTSEFKNVRKPKVKKQRTGFCFSCDIRVFATMREAKKASGIDAFNGGMFVMEIVTINKLPHIVCRACGAGI